jgi:hypothetical protein
LFDLGCLVEFALGFDTGINSDDEVIRVGQAMGFFALMSGK